MEKIKKRSGSLRTALLKYMPFCLAAIYGGMKLISKLSLLLRSRYVVSHSVYEVRISGGKVVYYGTAGGRAADFILSNMEFIFVPVWVLFCTVLTGYIFYSMELREPIQILTEASKKLSENELNTSIRYRKDNEMGRLCAAFDEMRKKLYENDLIIWDHVNERKRLSAAFSHDLRTPLTVLSGYVELMKDHGSELPPEKQADMLTRMQQQIERLMRYTENMNAAQKLEDIIPAREDTDYDTICSRLSETGRILCTDKEFSFVKKPSAVKTISADSSLIMQVFENMISNALRYASGKIEVTAGADEKSFIVCVHDDGKGFSPEELKKAAQPFYRDGSDNAVHFGLGLYICSILCRRHGGELRLENGTDGGASVTAYFRI